MLAYGASGQLSVPAWKTEYTLFFFCFFGGGWGVNEEVYFANCWRSASVLGLRSPLLSWPVACQETKNSCEGLSARGW